MNRIIKTLSILGIATALLCSCSNKVRYTCPDCSPKKDDVTRYFPVFEQRYYEKKGIYLNSYFFLYLEMKCEEEVSEDLPKYYYFANRKVNVLKYYNDLHEDINYIWGYPEYNRKIYDLFRYEKEIYYSESEKCNAAYVDYLSQFTTFLCFVGDSNYIVSPGKYNIKDFMDKDINAYDYVITVPEQEHIIHFDYLSFIPVKDSKLMLNSLIEFGEKWFSYDFDSRAIPTIHYPFLNRYDLLFEDGMDVYTEFPQKLEEYYENYDEYTKQAADIPRVWL